MLPVLSLGPGTLVRNNSLRGIHTSFEQALPYVPPLQCLHPPPPPPRNTLILVATIARGSPSTLQNSYVVLAAQPKPHRKTSRLTLLTISANAQIDFPECLLKAYDHVWSFLRSRPVRLEHIDITGSLHHLRSLSFVSCLIRLHGTGYKQWRCLSSIYYTG